MENYTAGSAQSVKSVGYLTLLHFFCRTKILDKPEDKLSSNQLVFYLRQWHPEKYSLGA